MEFDMTAIVNKDMSFIGLDVDMLNVLVGAVGTVIDQNCDDEDALAFTDKLHELETLLINVRARMRNAAAEHVDGDDWA